MESTVLNLEYQMLGIRNTGFQSVSKYAEIVCCRQTYWMKTNDLLVQLTTILYKKMAHGLR